MTRTWTYTVLLLLIAPTLLFGQFDPLAEGGDARLVFERALSAESREEWEVLLGLGLEAGGFSGGDASAIGQALLVQWLTERWAREVGAPDRQALVDAIAAADRQYLFVYDQSAATYGQDSAGDYLLQDSAGYLDPGGERDAWLAQVETAGDAALEAWRTGTQATYLELLAAEGIEQSSGIGQAFAASIAQYQAAVERDFAALVVRRERQLSYLRLQDTLSARREGEAQSAATVTDELVGATQVGLAEVTEALAAAVPDAQDAAGELDIDPEAWQESFRRQFEAGLAAWGDAEDRFIAERLAWETDAQAAYATAEGEWDQAFIEFGSAREAWFTQMNEILVAGQTAWGQQLADFAADVQAELASLAAAQAEEQAARAAEAQAYLAAYEQASGVLAMAEQNIAYLQEREAGLVQWERDTVQAIEDMRAQIETVRADEYQAQSEIQVWQAREAELLVKIGREGTGGSDYYNPVTEHQSTELSGITFHFMNYGQALGQVRDELGAAHARRSQAIAEGAGEIANLRAAIEAAQAEVRDSDLQLVQDELAYWHGVDGTGGILAQFTAMRDTAEGQILEFVGRVSDGLVGTSSAEQEQHRLTELVAMLQDEAAIAQAVADYAVDTSSQRATKAETADALAAANIVMAAAQTAYSDAIAELQRLSSVDVADAQASVSARQTELADLHAQLSEAKQQLENAMVAYRLQDAGVFGQLLAEIDLATDAFLDTGDPDNNRDYAQLVDAYVAAAWEAELVGAVAAGTVAETELIEGDATQQIPSLAELTDYRSVLSGLDLASFDPSVTGAAEFESYLVTTVGLDPLDPNVAAFVTAYSATVDVSDQHLRAVAQAQLHALYDHVLAETSYQIALRERALEFVRGRYAEDGTVLADSEAAIVLSQEAIAAVEDPIYLAEAQAQLEYRLALVSAQLALNQALDAAQNAEADWIATLDATAGQRETAAVTAETAASDAAAAATTAENERLAAVAALANASAGGDPDAIDAAQAVLDQAEAEAIAAADAAQAASVAASAARAAADQAAAALAAAQDSHWPDAELIAVLEAALDTTDPAQAMALEHYLIGARALEASAIGELIAARDVLVAADRSTPEPMLALLEDATVLAAANHAGQFTTSELNLLHALTASERDAAQAATAAREALESYGRYGFAWLEVRLRRTIADTLAVTTAFTDTVDVALTASDPIDAEVFADVYLDLIEAEAPASIIETVGLYARALAAEGHLTALDTAAIDAIGDTNHANAHRWLAAHITEPAPGVTLAQLAGSGLPTGVQLPNALDASIYRAMLEAAITEVGLAADFRTNGDLDQYVARAADMPAERTTLDAIRSTFFSAEAAYRDNLAQRIAVETERVAFVSNNIDYYDTQIVALQTSINTLEAEVDAKEAELTAALTAFTDAAERYEVQAAAVVAAETAYESARQDVRTAQAIDDYARSGAVDAAPDPQAALTRANEDLSAAQTALGLITDLIESNRDQVAREENYQRLLDREAVQLQAAQELTLAAEAISAEIGELEGTVQASESSIMRFLAENGQMNGVSDWITPDLEAISPSRLSGRSGEFRDYNGYFSGGDTTKFSTDLASWYVGIEQRGGSDFLRRMSVAMMYELGMAESYQRARNYTGGSWFNPYRYYLHNTPSELRNYDLAPFRNGGSTYRHLTPHVINTTQSDTLIHHADRGMKNSYSKDEATRNFYSRARGQYDSVKNTPEYHFFRLLMATGNHTSLLQTAVDQDIQHHVVASLKTDGWNARGNINPKRGAPRNDIARAINNMPNQTGADERGRLLHNGQFADDVATWSAASTRLTVLTETGPTLASVQAEISAKGGVVDAELTAAVEHVLANGSASQTASVATVVQAATARIVTALAETDAQLDQRAAQLTTAAAPIEQNYLAALGNYLAGTASEAELTAAMNARYQAPIFDAVDHLAARTDNAMAVQAGSASGELAKLQTLVNRAMQSAAHADNGYRTRIAHGYTMDHEQLERSIDRWSQETTNLIGLAVSEWNRSATHLEGQRVRWRQETEEHYAEAAQLWDMRHAQLVASRDAWLEDSTRQAMVAGSQAIAVQWDLQATALIADAESAIIPSFGVATPELAALVDQATRSSTLDDLIARADTLQSRARDTNVVVAAYLPTVNTRATEASTARAVTADLFDQVTERAAALAAIQAREQFAAQLAGMEAGIQDANDNVAFNLASQMEGAGYRRQGTMWRRSSAIGSTVFGGTEYETHEVAAYRDFTSPGFRGGIDLSDEALAGLSGRAIFTLVDQATEEMARYQVLVFGRSEEQKDRNSDSFVQAASAEEFADTLSQILSDAEAAWQRGAGYRKRENKDTEGLFNFHVGYAPVIDSDDPEKIGEAGYGQLGRIMGAFMINEARAQRGYAALITPGYRKPLWDDDHDNDGQKDGLFGAPNIASVVELTATIINPALGTAVMAAFTIADVATGYREAGEAFAEFGVKAAINAATGGTSGLFSNVGANVTNTAGKALINAGTSAARSAINTTITAGINTAVYGNYTTFGDFLSATGDELDSWEHWQSTAVAGVRGFSHTMIAGADFGGASDTYVGDVNKVASFGANAIASGFEYGISGQTKVNVLELGNFGLKRANGKTFTGGLLELGIGDGGSVFELGSGGHMLDVAGAMQGFETFTFNNAVRRYERTGNIEVLEGHTGTTDAGVALRSNYSSGDQAAIDQAWRIVDGTDLLRVGGELSDDGDANHMGLTTIENDQRVVHLATLGEEGDIASQLQAGTILQWEAHRDGEKGTFNQQHAETTLAAVSMAAMAKRLDNSKRYGEVFDLTDHQSAIVEALEEGGTNAVAEYVFWNYDVMSESNDPEELREIISEEGLARLEFLYGDGDSDTTAENLPDEILKSVLITERYDRRMQYAEEDFLSLNLMQDFFVGQSMRYGLDVDRARGMVAAERAGTLSDAQALVNEMSALASRERLDDPMGLIIEKTGDFFLEIGDDMVADVFGTALESRLSRSASRAIQDTREMRNLRNLLDSVVVMSQIAEFVTDELDWSRRVQNEANDIARDLMSLDQLSRGYLASRWPRLENHATQLEDFNLAFGEHASDMYTQLFQELNPGVGANEMMSPNYSGFPVGLSFETMSFDVFQYTDVWTPTGKWMVPGLVDSLVRLQPLMQ